MADEVATHNEEIRSICFRCEDQNEQIKEVFLEFLELERITGSEIGNTILRFFEKKGIDIKYLRGQCFDWTPNMQSEEVGVSSFIIGKSPKACIIYCCSHNINLSILQCPNKVINNLIEQYKALQVYFQSLIMYLYASTMSANEKCS